MTVQVMKIVSHIYDTYRRENMCHKKVTVYQNDMVIHNVYREVESNGK